MSWLTTTDLPPAPSKTTSEADEQDAMTHTAHDVKPSYQEKSGVANIGDLSYPWGVGLTTQEVEDEWELDGFDLAAAEDFVARPATTSSTVSVINLGDGGPVVVLYFRYVSARSTVTRSFTRSTDANSYKILLRKTTQTTTAQKLSELTPEE